MWFCFPSYSKASAFYLRVMVIFSDFLCLICVSQFSSNFLPPSLIIHALTKPRYFSLTSKIQDIEGINFTDATQWKKKGHAKDSLACIRKHSPALTEMKYNHLRCDTYMCEVFVISKQWSHGGKNINIMRLHNEPPTVFTVNGETSGSSAVFWLFMNKKTAMGLSWRASATTGTVLKWMLFFVIHGGKSWTISWCDATSQPVYHWWYKTF